MSNSEKKYFAIIFALSNALISSFALLVNESYVAVQILSIFSFLLFAIICFLESSNLLFLARTFILGLIGYFPMIIKVMVGRDALFSGFEGTTQGFDIVLLMYVITSYALLSNQIGLALAKKRNLVYSNANLAPIALSPEKGRQIRPYWWIAGLIGFMLAIYASYMYIRGYGIPVVFVGYSDPERGGAGLPYGSICVLGGVGIFSLFVSGSKGYIKSWKIILFITSFIYIVYSQILMGVRQDAMSTLFGLLILYGVVNRREIGLKLSYIPIIVVSYIFFEVWGVVRTLFAEGIPITSIVTSAFLNIGGATDAVRMGTISPIATTFSNTVWMIENNIIGYSLGQSYWEWILRIPPEALYPNRPVDYAWLFSEYGLSAGGGFFELAEVYMNFGLLGALIVPGIVSFLIAKSYYYAFYRQSMFSYFLLFSFLTIFLRGTWYQTFAFFRAFLVCMLLYFTYIFIVQILRPATRGIIH
jgi:hypothetical protein